MYVFSLIAFNFFHLPLNFSMIIICIAYYFEMDIKYVFDFNLINYYLATALSSLSLISLVLIPRAVYYITEDQYDKESILSMAIAAPLYVLYGPVPLFSFTLFVD